MKSIMEEASTIVKAIEKAWHNAGEPKEFSVKILEEPQRNFLGLTTRSAKIAILFSDKQTNQQAQFSSKTHKTKAYKEKTAQTKTKASKTNLKQEKIKERKPIDNKKDNVSVESEIVQQATRPTQPIWTEPMIQSIRQWFTQTLDFINKKDINFTIEPQHYHLKIKFEKPIYEEAHRQKQLFASLATLMLQMLKNKYKRPLRGYKLVITNS